jgi:hypothetical protein
MRARPDAVDAGTSLPGIVEAIERHRAFWDRGRATRPLVSRSRWWSVTTAQFDWGLGRGEGVLRPEDLDVGHFRPQYGALFEGHGPLDDDLFWPAMPPTAVPWLEGMLGCPIRYSLEGGSIAAVPPSWAAGDDPGDVIEALRWRPLEANPWYVKLLEFVDGIAAEAGGQFAVALPLTRGPWDLVAALRGMERLYLDLYDHPEGAARLADACADLWIAVTMRLADAIPTWHGGYVSFLGVWAPTFDPMPQDDASVSVSPELYRRVMASADRRVAQTWTNPIFHLHSAGLQVLDDVLGLLDDKGAADHAGDAVDGPGRRALNVDLDPSGPPVDQLLPLLAEVQDRGVPLHLLLWDLDRLRAVTESLSPRGLAVTYQPDPPS